MSLRWTTLIGAVALSAVGCHKLPSLRSQFAQVGSPPPVIVVPEPQLVVPVPLGPGETLAANQSAPFYLPPGVAPPPHVAQPAPRGPLTTPPPSPGLLDGFRGAISPDFGLPRAPVVENRLPNPLVVPVGNSELAWDQIADVVSDYFPIAREQPVQVLDGVVTEGVIETASQIGATLFEPHRPDSVGAFNRWEATFQTIRRRALLNVTPTAQGYAIGVQALKEIEDLPQPIAATAGAATLRNDNSLPSARIDNRLQTRSSGRWVPLGRDVPLEQRLLAEIQQRLTGGAR